MAGSIDVGGKYIQGTVTTPKKTALKTTQFGVATLGSRRLREMTIIWPAGHAGLVGVRLRYNGFPILPWSQNTAFVVDSGRERVFALDLVVNTNIVIETQNNDNIAHTLFFTAYTVELDADTDIAPYTPPTIEVV